MSPSTGYPVIVVRCLACGHEGWVPPERWDRPGRKYCRECGAERYELRRIWVGGRTPDNVVEIAGIL